MSTQHILLSMLMLATGIGIPIMATMNGSLGIKLANPFAASVILFFVAFLIAVGATLTAGLPSAEGVLRAPKWLMLAGFFVAFYIISITVAGPIIGIGNAVFLVLLGQIISTAVIDHFGWLGAPVSPISPQKLLGIAFMITGIYLARRVA
ncbi:MAG: DMT family transporter [Pseudomonadota bacterium]